MATTQSAPADVSNQLNDLFAPQQSQAPAGPDVSGQLNSLFQSAQSSTATQTVTPTPANDVGDSLNNIFRNQAALTPNTKAAAQQPEVPTVWQKIKTAMSQPILGDKALAILIPGMYGALQADAQIPKDATGPIATAARVAEGLERGEESFVRNLTTPTSLTLTAASAGVGAASSPIIQGLARIANLGFSAKALYDTYQNVPQFRQAIKDGDIEAATKIAAESAANLGLAGVTAYHSLGEVNPETTKGAKTQPTAAEKLSNPVTVDPASPVGKALAEPVPLARVADSEASAEHLRSEDTVKPATPDSSRVVSEDHTPTTSKDEILAAAIQHAINTSGELTKMGIEPVRIQTQADIKTMLDQAADHIGANLDPRANVTITLPEQRQLASDLGMTVDQLLSRKTGEAFNAEQAIAARALLHASGNDVLSLAREATATGDTTKFIDSLGKHRAILDQVAGMTAEAGRALGSFRADETNLPVANVLSDLSPEAATKAAQLLSKLDPTDSRQINEFTQQIKPSSTPDKIFEYYRNALLSSPKTAIVKGASEVGMMALEMAKKAVTGGIEQGKAAIEGRSPDALASDSWYYTKGVLQGLQHLPDVLRGKFSLADSPDFESTQKTQAIKGTLEKIIRIPSTILGRQTDAMYMLNYFGELSSQAARAAAGENLSGDEFQGRYQNLLDNPTTEMRSAADETALHNTFQWELGKTGKATQEAIRSNPILKFLAPFYKTPINLIKASGEVSPYGLLKGTATGDLGLQVRGLLGSSIAAGVAGLAAEGYITGGGPTNVGQKKTLQDNGWQPYSIKVGDRYFSYHRFEPLGLVLSSVADAVHASQNADPESPNPATDTAVSHLARNMSDFPFLTQLSSLLTLVQGKETGNNLATVAGRQLGEFIPQIVANAAQINDPTIRRPETFTQAIETRIPGLTKNVPPAVNIAGQEVQRPASGLGGINPFPSTQTTRDAVLKELARLEIPTPLEPKAIEIGRQKVALTEPERIRMAELEGQLFYDQVLQRAINNPQYPSLPDDKKRDVIKHLHEAVVKSRPRFLREIRAGE